MKITSTARFQAWTLGVCLSLSFARADSLDPAGPPGSAATRMPALSQIEPRQIIDTLPFTITNSGPYVIIRNLAGTSGACGITIQTNSVTLDLNGFALTGVAGSLDGIVVDRNSSFITIKNGVLSGWGQNGINANPANNSKAENLLVSDNLSHGITLGTNSMVIRCTANNNSANGISVGSGSTLLDSSARENGNIGLLADSGCLIQKCAATRNASHGFSVQSLGQITFCTASGNGNNGFDLLYSCSVLDSCAYGNFEGFHGWDGIVFSRSVAYSNRYGFYAAMNCSFIDCAAYTNTWQGIYGDRGCVVSRCTAYGNFDGIGASNGSKVSDSSACYNIGHGYWLGPSTLLQSCAASANATGVAAQAGCYVSGNEICDSTALGIVANNRCRIENNHIVSCLAGIQITGIDNILAGNTLLDNTTDYDIPGGNKLSLIISHLPATISWPAQIKLSGTLTGSGSANGITISSANVSVDLNGHSLIGGPGSYDGIAVAQGCQNVSINNGVISQWGKYGINAGNAISTKISGVQVYSNGYEGTVGGILLGSNSVVRDCQVTGNKTDGLYVKDGSTVASSTFSGNGANGIYMTRGCTISQCNAIKNGSDGIYTETSCLISRCNAYQNGYDGIRSDYGGTIESCVSSTNADDGIYANTGNQILNNTCDANNYGIELSGARNTVDGNSVTRTTTYGFYFGAGKNLIIRNRTSGNANNYYNLSPNAYGPIDTVSAGVINSTNPWANFDF